MCGIAGIINSDRAVDFLLTALDQLETRGYDGFGVTLQGSSVLKVGYKEKPLLDQKVKESQLTGKTGIAHNRWATHGVADERNAHPHQSGSIKVVHNGDIPNYQELKNELQGLGYHFKSETDTEVFAVLVNHYYAKGLNFFDSVKQSIMRLDPTSRFAFLVLNENEPDTIIAACRGSNPILWSYDPERQTVYLASQASVFSGYVQTYQEVPVGNIFMFNSLGLIERHNFSGEISEKLKEFLITDQFISEKTGKHWMYQEMRSVSETIRNAMGRRATIENGIMLGGIEKSNIKKRLRSINRFIIAGCGTSYHAAQIIAMQIEEIAGIQSQAIIASEYIYRTTVFDPETTALICISQSGETADVIRLMQEWKPREVLMLGIVNVPDTQIPRLTDAGIYCNIGPEIAVASTKAFIGQVVCGTLFALWMGQQRGISVSRRNEIIQALLKLPKQAEEVFQQEPAIKEIAKTFASAKNFLFIGRKYHAVIAAEGALKLKEISYIHAESYPSGEMKHGTIALIDEFFPTFVIAPYDSVYSVTMHNVSEITARKGRTVIVTTSDSGFQEYDGDIIFVPKTLELLSPILTVIPTQLFAYYVATMLGYDPDQPRNLAKSVTVE